MRVLIVLMTTWLFQGGLCSQDAIELKILNLDNQALFHQDKQAGNTIRLQLSGGKEGDAPFLRLMAQNAMVDSPFLMEALRNQQLQQQIDLTDQQKLTLTNAKAELAKAYQKLQESYPELKNKSLSAELRASMRKELDEQYKLLREQADLTFKRSLLTYQLTLFSSIKFRAMVKQRGYFWTLSNDPFGDKINISENQKKELYKIKRETEAAIDEKIAEMRMGAREKMLTVLNAGQRKSVQELEGEKPTKKSTLKL